MGKNKLQVFEESLSEAVIKIHREAMLCQKKALIEKACQWIESYLFDIGFPDDWCRDSANLKSGKQRFLEVMEE